jgi:hypothetical protein
MGPWRGADGREAKSAAVRRNPKRVAGLAVASKKKPQRRTVGVWVVVVGRRPTASHAISETSGRCGHMRGRAGAAQRDCP